MSAAAAAAAQVPPGIIPEDEEETVDRVFEGAVVFVQATLPEQPDSVTQGVKMQLYGLYKQGTEGDVNVPTPAMFSLDFKAKAKWCAPIATRRARGRQGAIAWISACPGQDRDSFLQGGMECMQGEDTDGSDEGVCDSRRRDVRRLLTRAAAAGGPRRPRHQHSCWCTVQRSAAGLLDQPP